MTIVRVCVDSDRDSLGRAMRAAERGGYAVARLSDAAARMVACLRWASERGGDALYRLACGRSVSTEAIRLAVHSAWYPDGGESVRAQLTALYAWTLAKDREAERAMSACIVGRRWRMGG